MAVPTVIRELDRPEEHASPLRTAAAGCLVVCYAVACAWSLWSRLHAVEFFALTSTLSAVFIMARATGRIAAGLVADLLASGVAVLLPGIGEVADAIAALIAVSVMSRKFLRFLRTLPYGLACCGLYAGLWLAGRHLASALGTGASGGHSVLLIAASLVVTAGGLLYVYLVARAAIWAGASWTDAVLYTVGYPWVLLMFVVTYFIPDSKRHTGRPSGPG